MEVSSLRSLKLINNSIHEQGGNWTNKINWANMANWSHKAIGLIGLIRLITSFP